MIDDPDLLDELHGYFIGVSKAPSRIEALIQSHVPKKHIKRVEHDYDTKWFDYRRMAPGHCFMLCVHHYHRAFKRTARKMLDYKNSDPRRVALIGHAVHEKDGRHIWQRDSAFVTGMWSAMNAIDSLGMPYDLFMGWAMDYAFDRKWTRLPRPSQLYSDHMAIYCLDQWEQRLQERIVFGKHHYLKERPEEYVAWLLDHIKTKTRRVSAATVLIEAGQLVIDDLKPILNDHEMKRLRTATLDAKASVV